MNQQPTALTGETRRPGEEDKTPVEDLPTGDSSSAHTSDFVHVPDDSLRDISELVFDDEDLVHLSNSSIESIVEVNLSDLETTTAVATSTGEKKIQDDEGEYVVLSTCGTENERSSKDPPNNQERSKRKIPPGMMDFMKVNYRNDTTILHASKDDLGKQPRLQEFCPIGSLMTKLWKRNLPRRNEVSKEDVLLVLKDAPTLPHRLYFENKFSEQILTDREVVLAFCQREDFSAIHKERGFVLPGVWMSDRQIMLIYCQKVPDSLRLCSVDLQCDREIVQNAVQLDGMNLQHACSSLREDPEMVRLACRSNGHALMFCPRGHTLYSLLNDAAFMADLLSRCPSAAEPICDLVPDCLRNGNQQILEGLTIWDIPSQFMTQEYWKHRRTQLKQFILDYPSAYLSLDGELQKDEELAYQALVSERSNAEIHTKAIQHFPKMASEHLDVALAIAQRGDLHMLETLLLSKPSLGQEIEIMKAAIQREGGFLNLAAPELKGDAKFVQEVTTRKTVWGVLWGVNTEMFQKHPEILTAAMSHGWINPSGLWTEKLIPDTLWNNKKLCLEWLQRGGPANPVLRRVRWREDHDIAMAVAKYQWHRFMLVGKGLRSDKEFLWHVLEENGKLYRQDLENLDAVLEAVTCDGLHVSLIAALVVETSRPAWTDNEETMKALIEHNASFMPLASPRLRNCPTFIRDILSEVSMKVIFRDISAELLLQHVDVLLAAIFNKKGKDFMSAVRLIPVAYWRNKDFCLGWLKRSGSAKHLLHAKFRWKKDADIAKAVGKYRWQEFHLVSEDFQKDRLFVWNVLEENKKLLRQDLQNPYLVMRAIRSAKVPISRVQWLMKPSPPAWTDNEEIMRTIIEKNRDFLTLASPRLQKCPTLLNVSQKVNRNMTLQKVREIWVDQKVNRNKTMQNVHEIWQEKTGGTKAPDALPKTPHSWPEDPKIAMAMDKYEGQSLLSEGEGLWSNRDQPDALVEAFNEQAMDTLMANQRVQEGPVVYKNMGNKEWLAYIVKKFPSQLWSRCAQKHGQQRIESNGDSDGDVFIVDETIQSTSAGESCCV